VLGRGEALAVPLALAERLADVLDLDLCSDRLRPPALTGGVPQPVPAALADVVAGLPETWWEHEELAVDGRPVSWWRDEEGAVHAATLDGLARGLAAAAGRWGDRLLLAAALEAPARLDELLAEARLED
jgi:hypothetical protein